MASSRTSWDLVAFFGRTIRSGLDFIHQTHRFVIHAQLSFSQPSLEQDIHTILRHLTIVQNTCTWEGLCGGSHLIASTCGLTSLFPHGDIDCADTDWSLPSQCRLLVSLVFPSSLSLLIESFLLALLGKICCCAECLSCSSQLHDSHVKSYHATKAGADQPHFDSPQESQGETLSFPSPLRSLCFVLTRLSPLAAQIRPHPAHY